MSHRETTSNPHIRREGKENKKDHEIDSILINAHGTQEPLPLTDRFFSKINKLTYAQAQRRICLALEGIQ